MEEKDVFKSLPQELRIEILSRLPFDNTIGKCKCVSKAWRELIEGSEFATWHCSRWTVAVTTDLTPLKPYKIWALDHAAGSSTRPATSFGFPHSHNYNQYTLTLHGSANGLLFFFNEGRLSTTFLICNPITREYIELSTPPHVGGCDFTTLGFGASKVSGQYKVFITFTSSLHPDTQRRDHVMCGVYNLALGFWRSVAIREDWFISMLYRVDTPFWDGNLHFLVEDDNDDDLKKVMVYCFDLETELFTVSFPAPRGYGGYRGWLSVLDGRLCLFDHSSKDEICMWFMNKYGDGNSWIKEYVVKTPPPTFYGEGTKTFLFPIKVFKDGGDILFGTENGTDLFIYSNSTKVIKEYDLLPLDRRYFEVVVYTPTFLSLKTMGIHCHVESF